jgi:hypothetical protein
MCKWKNFRLGRIATVGRMAGTSGIAGEQAPLGGPWCPALLRCARRMPSERSTSPETVKGNVERSRKARQCARSVPMRAVADIPPKAYQSLLT